MTECGVTSGAAGLFAGQHEAAHADAQDPGHAAASVRLEAVARPRRVAARRRHAPAAPVGATIGAAPPPPPPPAPRAPPAAAATAVGAAAAHAPHVAVAAGAAGAAAQLQQQQLERRHDGREGFHPHPRLAPQPALARTGHEALAARRRPPHGQKTFW